MPPILKCSPVGWLPRSQRGGFQARGALGGTGRLGLGSSSRLQQSMKSCLLPIPWMEVCPHTRNLPVIGSVGSARRDVGLREQSSPAATSDPRDGNTTTNGQCPSESTSLLGKEQVMVHSAQSDRWHGPSGVSFSSTAIFVVFIRPCSLKGSDRDLMFASLCSSTRAQTPGPALEQIPGENDCRSL